MFNLCYRKYGKVFSLVGKLGLMGAIARFAKAISYRSGRQDEEHQREDQRLGQDGEIAFNLASLYDSMQRLLVEANVLGDTFLLDEVSALLDEIKSGEHSFPGDAGKV